MEINIFKIRWKRLTYFIVLIGALFTLTRCTSAAYNGQCGYPETVSEELLLGAWQLDYENFYISHFGYETIVNGKEEIVFNEDGTFIQTFKSDADNFISSQNKWELVTNTPDSPKVKLYGMKYFAYGIENANNSSQFVLDPQTTDSLRNQNAKEKGANMPNPSVTYPDDGYVFLYPRLCSGQMSLLQMVVRPRDPDNVSIQNPVFTR